VNYDVFAQYPCQTEEDVRKIVGNIKEPYQELESIYSRILLLTSSLIEKIKDFAKNGHFKYGGGYRSLVFNSRGPNLYTSQLIRPALTQMDALGITPPKIIVKNLPKFSFALQIHFQLATPLVVGDSENFYVHECAVLKEKVFKVPEIPATTWKGNLRNVALRLVKDDAQIEVCDRLFGTSTEEVLTEDYGAQGRLRFYPSFMNAIGLEVINPHSRRTKSGTVPIIEEIMIPKASGTLSVVYMPLDLLLSEKKRPHILTQISEDLQFFYPVLEHTLFTYGLGAKSNRGFGIIRNQFINHQENGQEKPGGFFEMTGVPVYKDDAEKNGTRKKENRFSYIRQLKRIINKVIDELAQMAQK